MITGRLVYDAGQDRYQIVDGDGEVQHPGLHCGECLDVFAMTRDSRLDWVPTRMEYDSRGWYLVEMAGYTSLENMIVRYGR